MNRTSLCTSTRSLLLLSSLAGLAWLGGAGCGPSMEPGGVMTPEQRLQEEEMKAYEAEKAEAARGDDYDVPAETDEREAFDKKQAELEMKRASLSARTCVGVVEDKKKPEGVADVSVTFNNDGHVREATIGSPYTDTPLGECVLNAYRSVIVPTFSESEYTLGWQLEWNPPPSEDETAFGAKMGDKKDDKDAKDSKGDKKDGKDEKKSSKK
jgi:hypothetical protein